MSREPADRNVCATGSGNFLETGRIGVRRSGAAKPSLFVSSISFCEIFRRLGLRQEQIGGHAETFCQRADVRQRQPPFAAQNHRTQRPVNLQ